MTELEYISGLEKETGLVYGKEFGFIMGTMTPFHIERGMESAAMIGGYEVWKTYKDGSYTSLRTVGLNFEDTVTFLKCNSIEETNKFLQTKGFLMKITGGLHGELTDIN